MDPTKQTVAELHAKNWQDPFAFFMSIPQSLEFNIMWMLMLAGVAGSIASYIFKWANGYTNVSFIDYFFRSNARRTVLAGIAFFTTIFSGTALGAFVTPDGVFVGWLNVLWVGVSTGFTVDAAVNKAARDPAIDRRGHDVPDPLSSTKPAPSIGDMAPAYPEEKKS